MYVWRCAWAAIGLAPCSRGEAGFSIFSMFWISRSSSVITVNVDALENVSATLLVSLRFPVVGMAILISFTKKGLFGFFFGY